MPRTSNIVLLLLVVASLESTAWGFHCALPLSSVGVTPLSSTFPTRVSATPAGEASPNENDESGRGGQEGEEEVIAQSVVKIDDGGSDLTDRFKWKVNALMGVFDPQEGVDDERQDGNIMNAILNFPVRYSFNVVGRTGGDEASAEKFVQQVKDVVINITGDEDGLQCQITPRSKNFTKVTVEVSVENAAMISAAYDSLEALELTVMRF